MYTTRHLQILFDVSPTTIRNWCQEFASYLSPTATPEANRQRQFTDDDLSVLALVSAMRNTGGTYEAMHAALKSGQRGELPDTGGIVPVSPESALVTLQREKLALQAQLAAVMGDNQQQAGQIKMLREMLAEAQERIYQLERKVGKMES